MAEVSATHADLMHEFSSVTGVEGDRAKFYLESAAWDLQVALASFYEDDGDILDDVVPRSRMPDVPNPTAANPTTAPAVPSSRFATIDTLKKEETSSDEEEGQAFYAGGSERSGQQVIGPGKKKKDIISEMFKSAMDHGAEVVDGGHDSGLKSKLGVFKGTGYKLGAYETDSTSEQSGVASSSSNSLSFTPPQTTDVTLKLWKNGFSLDDGSLRDYHDPANQTFLNSIRGGEIPAELIKQVKGAEVTLNMEDHRSENFVTPKSMLKAFSGTGHKLGSPAPVPVFNSSSVGERDLESNARECVNIDENQPTTNVQIRLADGSRMTVNLNHSHTIGDLYRYITTARPQLSSTAFVLMTTFPNRELNNREASLKDESLLNAVIVQRFK